MKRKPILRNSLKLLVCMKLASYSLILDEKNKNIVLERMRNPSAASAYGRFTASRFLNRQIKYVVADLHRALIETELKNLQEALQASSNTRSWGPTFISVLILGIVTEIMQFLVRCKASSDMASLERNDPSSIGRIRAIHTTATAEIEKMESTVEFTRSLFNRKYQSQNLGNNKGFKPIFKHADLVKLEDQPSRQLALDVKNIIHEYGEFNPLWNPFDWHGITMTTRREADTQAISRQVRFLESVKNLVHQTARTTLVSRDWSLNFCSLAPQVWTSSSDTYPFWTELISSGSTASRFRLPYFDLNF